MSDRLPLYIGSRSSIRLDDGPSLVLSAAGRAGSRLPLNRISRLIAPVNCGIDEAVLIACARKGIPVLWHEHDGTPLAQLVTVGRPHRLRWEERLLAAVSRSDWQERYGTWRASQLRMARLYQERRLEGHSFPANVFPPSLTRSKPARDGSDRWLDALLQRIAVPIHLGRMAVRIWEVCALSLLAEHWQAIGVDAESMVYPERGVNIGGDFASCLAIGMIDVAFRRSSGVGVWERTDYLDDSAIQRSAALLFERHKIKMLHLTAAMHDRFHRWILELESWR